MVPPIRSQHILAHCGLCNHDMVVCAACGNNSCNAGYGRGPDGEPCKSCPEAYEHQDLHWEDPTRVEFQNDAQDENVSRRELVIGLLTLSHPERFRIVADLNLRNEEVDVDGELSDSEFVKQMVVRATRSQKLAALNEAMKVARAKSTTEPQ